MSTDVHCVTMFKSQLLYQLSYAGARVIVFAESSSTCRHGHGRPPALLSKTVVKPQNCCQTSRRPKGANCWCFRTLSPTPGTWGSEREEGCPRNPHSANPGPVYLSVRAPPVRLSYR